MKKLKAGLLAFVMVFVCTPYISVINVNAEEFVQQSNYGEDTGFTKYDLTETELLKIASLCQAEQGTALGAAAEASLAANRYELYGWNYSSLYDYIRNCRWFARAASHMDRMNAYSDVVDAVRTVLVDGKRTLPKFVDDHDCFSDIWRSETNGVSIKVSDRSQYVKHQTTLYNVYGGGYWFYTFADWHSDPFGYSNSALRDVYEDMYYDLYTGERIYGDDVGSMLGSNPFGSVIPDGDYIITNAGEFINSESDNVQFGSESSVWTFSYQEDGFYKIKKQGTDSFLDVEDGSTYRSANVILSPASNYVSQEWAVVPVGTGYALQSRAGSFYFSIEGTPVVQPDEESIPAINANVDYIYDTGNQEFAIIPVNNVQPIVDTNYHVKYDDKTLTLKDNSFILGDDATKTFTLTHRKDGWYTIGNNEDVLTIIDGAVKYSPYGENQNQLWMLRQVDGKFALISAINGYFLSKDLQLVPAMNDAKGWSINSINVVSLNVTAPARKEYMLRNKFDFNGLKVVARYSDNTERDVTAEVKLEPDMAKSGYQDVAVNYGGVSEKFTIHISHKDYDFENIFKLNEKIEEELTIKSVSTLDVTSKFLEMSDKFIK